ncbi:hypothetical protein G7011_01370 [Pseudomonas plecoglossicida]|uniref:hypothetical protein n=1 Tax=Pseudomonas plecoglossicida TaxID=70775 RepID=UPI0015E2FFF0|nr:hypothetical protein [Pseudomonas plecoglossicida]MBA1195761.1 hypothetical protein [Pseudomonas plecoglossicida]
MKTLKNIADEAYDDLLVLQEKLGDFKTIFRAVHKLLSEHDTAGRLAGIGAVQAEEWQTHAEDWARKMDENLRNLEPQQPAPQKPTSRKRGAGGAA